MNADVSDALDSTNALVSTAQGSNLLSQSKVSQGDTLTILYWQAASVANPYLSSGTKDVDAAV